MTEDTDILMEIRAMLPQLSKGHKRIAYFLLEHYEKAAYLTAARLGEIVGVSESTVVRFACEIGFDGYPKLQQALGDLVKIRLTASQRLEISADRMAKEDKHILKAVLTADAERIQHTLHDIDVHVFDEVVDEIANAKTVYVVGGRSAATVAGFFSFYLHLMIENVVPIQVYSASESLENMFRISAGDVCVAFSFPRYSKRTIKAVAFASAQNATTIAVTDSPDSPIAAYARHSLIVRSDMISFIDSLVAPLSLANALLVAVSVKKKTELKRNFDILEKMWSEHQVY